MIVVDSVTLLPPSAFGEVVVGGSHCGVYAAHLAARAQAKAVLLNDASVGKDRAGIAGLEYLGDLGVPAATIAHDSARIGDGADCLHRGTLSHVNQVAAALGCAMGQRASEAAMLLQARAPQPRYTVPPAIEARHRVDGRSTARSTVWALDSVSLVRDDDAGAIVVTGSHGALLGGRPETALGCDAVAALFNDAGGGVDGVGFTRLPVLDTRGIAAATVAAASARIGDGRSTYQDGVVSRANRTAMNAGITIGMSAQRFVERIADVIERRGLS